MRAQRKQLEEWQSEDAKLFKLAFDAGSGFSETTYKLKKGHRKERPNKNNLVATTIHERVVKNNSKYDGIQRGTKGFAITRYK